MSRAPWWRSYFDSDYFDLHDPLFDEARSRAEVAGMRELLALPVGARVLDAPCGWGRHTGLLAEAGCEVFGADLSPDLLRRAPAGRGRTPSPATRRRTSGRCRSRTARSTPSSTCSPAWASSSTTRRMSPHSGKPAACCGRAAGCCWRACTATTSSPATPTATSGRCPTARRSASGAGSIRSPASATSGCAGAAASGRAEGALPPPAHGHRDRRPAAGGRLRRHRVLRELDGRAVHAPRREPHRGSDETRRRAVRHGGDAGGRGVSGPRSASPPRRPWRREGRLPPRCGPRSGSPARPAGAVSVEACAADPSETRSTPAGSQQLLRPVVVIMMMNGSPALTVSGASRTGVKFGSYSPERMPPTANCASAPERQSMMPTIRRPPSGPRMSQPLRPSNRKNPANAETERDMRTPFLGGKAPSAKLN
jgi:hypothetical protein